MLVKNIFCLDANDIILISCSTIPHTYPRMYHIKPFKNRKNHDHKKLAGSTNFRANHRIATKQNTKTIQKELLFYCKKSDMPQVPQGIV